MKIEICKSYEREKIKAGDLMLVHGYIGYAYSDALNLLSLNRKGVWIRYSTKQESATFYAFDEWEKYQISKVNLKIGNYQLADYPEVQQAILNKFLKHKISLDTDFTLIDLDGKLTNLTYPVFVLKPDK